MPRGDRTGPMGMGPMTGRAAGYCAGYASPMPGRGYGVGWGGGWGRGWRWRHWFHAAGWPGPVRFGYPPSWAPMTQEHEMESLRGQAEWLKDQLDAINLCIAELEKEE